MAQVRPEPENPVRRWFGASPEDLRVYFIRHGLTYRDLRLKLKERWSTSTIHQTLNGYREPGYDLKWAYAELAAELEDKKGCA